MAEVPDVVTKEHVHHWTWDKDAWMKKSLDPAEDKDSNVLEYDCQSCGTRGIEHAECDGYGCEGCNDVGIVEEKRGLTMAKKKKKKGGKY